MTKGHLKENVNNDSSKTISINFQPSRRGVISTCLRQV